MINVDLDRTSNFRTIEKIEIQSFYNLIFFAKFPTSTWTYVNQISVQHYIYIKASDILNNIVNKSNNTYLLWYE